MQLATTDGIAFLERALEVDSRILSIVMTGHGNIELAVRAMKAGAADFLTKPFQIELVRLAVSRCWNSTAYGKKIPCSPAV